MIRFLIQRPVGTTMIFIALVVLGLLASRKLPVSLMPDVAVPEITVQVNYNEFTATKIEGAVIAPLKRELLQVIHLSNIKTVAQDGYGTIHMRFEYGTNIDYASIEVHEKIDAAMLWLPKDMDRPKVLKASAVDIPVFVLNLYQKNGYKMDNFLPLSDFAENVIKRRLEQVPEVALVDISGVNIPEIRIFLDTTKVNQLRIRFQDIAQAINDNNQEIGHIVVKEGHYQYNVKVGNSFMKKEDIEQIYFKSGNRVFQIKDIAKVTLSSKNLQGMYDANGKRAVAMAVVKQWGAKLVDMKAAVTDLIGEFERDYPELIFEVTKDQSQLLHLTISSLQKSLVIGCSLAFIVMFFFLKDMRGPLLVGFTLPVSLIISLFFFQLIGITINIISLS